MIADALPVEVFVGVGANIEDPLAQVAQALMELGEIRHTRVTARSALYRTAPVGKLDQPDFINAVAKLESALAPRDLLDALFEIENRHGRRRSEKNAPRTLDLDLLLYGNDTIDEMGLSLPHPRLHQRAFVLVPLAEIAPDTVVPGRGRVRDLVARIDRGGVERVDAA
jgi:2-amino-4-hydroxy-6-hydroxymethyldihydropteridine diphosphokinase